LLYKLLILFTIIVLSTGYMGLNNNNKYYISNFYQQVNA